MTDVSTGMPKRDVVTFGSAAKDIGFFSLAFAMIVGGPSYLSIAQAAFVEHDILHALGWIVTSYNVFLAIIGSALEPFLTPAITFLRERFDLNIALQAHWRQLFVLGMVFVTSLVRSTWQEKRYVGAAITGAALTLVVLFCACISSLSPLDTWWKNAWAAFWMTFVIAAVFSVSAVKTRTTFMQRIVSREPDTTERVLIRPTNLINSRITIHAINFVGCIIAAIAAALLSLIPGMLGAGAFVTYSGVLIWSGIDAVASGLLQGVRSYARLGFTILGGFIAAGLIYLADRLVAAA